jgi:AraC-like DNA-binding protein
MDWDGIAVRIDWTRCTRRRWPPKPRLAFTPQERRKERNVLLYWWAGRGQRQLLSGMVPIHAGLCHWSRPGWTYECIQSVRNPLGVTAIHFDLLDARGRVIPPEDARLPPEPLRVPAPRLADEVTRWIAERAMDTRAGVPLPPRIEHVANGLLLALLMKLDYDTPASGGVAGDPGQLAWRRLTTHIQEHLHDLGSTSALAAQAGYTRSHFSRLFKAHAGLSPQQYVINARIALAKELLRGTTLTVSEVAERAGYGDAFQFSKQFRQRTAKAPSAYRAECGDRASPVGRG